MDTYVNWDSSEISDLTLKQVYQQANLDRQEDINWIIKTLILHRYLKQNIGGI